MWFSEIDIPHGTGTGNKFYKESPFSDIWLVVSEMYDEHSFTRKQTADESLQFSAIAD